MSNKDYDLEQRAEDILRAFAMEMGNNNEKFVRAVLDENQPDPPLFLGEEPVAATAETSAKTTPSSPATEELPAEFTPVSPRRSRKVLRRALILAAVLILMMGLVVCTSEGVRLKLSSLFFGDAPGSTRVLDDSNLVVDLEKVELGYVPEGFEVVSDEMNFGFERKIKYGNTEKDAFVLSITKTEQYVGNVDDERSQCDDRLINDKVGFLFYDGVNYTLVWQFADCTLQLISTIEVYELEEIAKHVILR